MLAAFVVLTHARASAQAQTAPASPSPAPSPTATPTPPWTVSGFGDVTYTSPLPAGGTFVFVNGAPDRVFDGITSGATPSMTRFVPNSFNINVRKNTTQGLGGQFEITLGSDANVINSFGYTPNTYTDVTQAFLYYATGPLTLDVGKFETLAGYEVIESPSDNNISRSILFGYAVPFTNTGVRLVYAPTSRITYTAGVNFGWDQLEAQPGSGLQTLEAAIAWTPSTIFSLSGDVYDGREPSVLTPYPVSGATVFGTRALFDLVGHWNPSSKWNFGVNYDTAQQTNDQSFTSTGAIVTSGAGPALGTAKWYGVAGYAILNLNSNVTFAGRLESFDDASGVRTGIAQTWDEGTLTFQYVPTATNWKFRAELRGDWSNQSVFARYTLPVGSSATNNSSIGAEAIYTFP